MAMAVSDRSPEESSDIDCVTIAADAASEQETHVADALTVYFRLRERKFR